MGCQSACSEFHVHVLGWGLGHACMCSRRHASEWLRLCTIMVRDHVCVREARAEWVSR